ncbi:MAG: glycosyltransferase family 2 protein [Opitutaceae bacterium]|nr:glycosyltransferase family 2 protein [Opitutaceae bacterium]MBP9913931.1 glycosyltransferase family 2 protein [Opitutaceae bacterium]
MKPPTFPPLPARPKLSVIVPAFNERATARVALDAITAKRVAGWDLEIIIVESNSPDGTRDIVNSYAALPQVKIILEERARGKGHAVRNGLNHATGDVILIQDADLEYDLADYEKLLAPFTANTHTFVLGSRHGDSLFIRKFDEQVFHAFVLNAGHWFFTALIDVSLGLTLRDPFTMYKVFRRECLAGLTFESNRFDFDWEILIKLVRKGHVPIEIPVKYTSRSFKEGKKVSMFRDPPMWLWAWAKFRFQRL